MKLETALNCIKVINMKLESQLYKGNMKLETAPTV